VKVPTCFVNVFVLPVMKWGRKNQGSHYEVRGSAIY